MLQTLRDYDPVLTSHELNHPFIECATFADDIKYNGGAWQSDYHYVDITYVDEGTASDWSIPAPKPHYLTLGIQNIADWLSGKNGTSYLTSYMYTYINNNLYPGRPDLAASYALRLLIHFVGDISQPFHCESRFDSKYPSGDAGANAFPLPSHYSVTELHALMDKVLYVEKTNIPRPMSDANWATLTSSTNFYQGTYASTCCSDPATWNNQDFVMWQNEAYDIATTLYTGVYENVLPDQAYLDKNTPIIQGRIVLGGYRLYALMRYIFDPAAP